jgi:hypothetical protein
MCDPGTIALIGTIASGVGGAVNANINNSAIRQQNKQNEIAMLREAEARSAESARQREMEATQAATVADALFKSNPAAIVEAADESSTDQDNDYVASVDEYNTPLLQGQLGAGGVSADIGRIIADAAKNTREVLKAQSVLAGQNTGLAGIQDALSRMGSEISTVNSNRRGSGAVSMLETSIPAATVMPSNSILGDLLMLGGQAMAGASGRIGGNRGRVVPTVRYAQSYLPVIY